MPFWKIGSLMKLLECAAAAVIAIATLNCNNLFHEIPSSGEPAGSSAALSAGVHYVYPKNNFSNVPLNTKVLVAFATDMDISTVTSDSIKVEDAIGPVSGSLEFHGDRIVLFKPGVNFSNYTEYTVTLKSGMRDKAGQTIAHDYSFKYVTGEQVDTTAPVVEVTYPADSAMIDIAERYVSVKFNKEIDPGTITITSLSVRDGMNALPGRVSYNASLRTAYFHMEDTFSNYSTYTGIVSVAVADLCGNHLATEKAWSFRTGVRSFFVPLESAKNEGNATFTFGDNNGYGRLLRMENGNRLDSVFLPGQSLDGVFDTGTEGPFAEGKYIRIVVNGFNLMDQVRGLGLTPRYVNFVDGIYSPPRNECYIDLYRGHVSLPRPIYWSRMESIENLTNAEIATYSPSIEGSFYTATPLKTGFGNGIYQYIGAPHGTYSTTGILYPCGNTVLSTGLVSFWCGIRSEQYDNLHSSSAIGVIQGDVALNIYSYDGASSLILTVNGQSTSISISSNVMHHVYCVWDINGGLTGGKTVRVFLNGDEVLSSTVVWNAGARMQVRMVASEMRYNHGVVTATSWIDNLQMWDHNVSENPAWLYNNSAGRETALHYMYGAPDYRPKLTGPNNGVGYYYLP